MAMYGYVSLCMAVYGYVWKYVCIGNSLYFKLRATISYVSNITIMMMMMMMIVIMWPLPSEKVDYALLRSPSPSQVYLPICPRGLPPRLRLTFSPR